MSPRAPSAKSTNSAPGAPSTNPAKDRIGACFATLAADNRAGFIAFVTAGDPDYEVSAAILDTLPEAGADIIEIGMPFSDPVAEGPSIQRASRRALAAGMTLGRTLDLAAEFRKREETTPIVLMGYFNPIHSYGPERFVGDAVRAGVDGLIIVDLPPEEESDLRPFTQAAGLHLIRLVTPTTDTARLDTVLKDAGGFVYYVSVTGTTGVKSAAEAEIRNALDSVRQHTTLPVAVGFGIRTPEQAAVVARIADAAVVGSAIVDTIAASLKEAGGGNAELVSRVAEQIKALAAAVHGARSQTKAGSKT
ncbi:MAG: tryptophan synthase subunit alpha [Alphaproteobacteria bacterium]|nr:tryptophan synthase subunit alpha [Alphaproteobacteria bacterium]